MTMSVTSNHIICRQYLNIELQGTESDGLALQRSLTGLCHQWVTPAIEQLLKRFEPSKEHLFIERLEIDAGTLTLERMEQDLPGAIAQALEKTMREHIPQGKPSPSVISGNIRHMTVQRAVQDAFIYFLKTGSLPWTVRLPAGGTLEQIVLASWQDAVTSGREPVVDDKAVLQTLTDAQIRRRLVRQFSPAFHETLLSKLSPAARDVIAALLQTLYKSGAPSEEKKLFARQLWETVFNKVAGGQAFTDVDLVSEAWKGTAGNNLAISRVVEQHWPGAIIQFQAHRNKTRIAENPLGDAKTEGSRPEPLPPPRTGFDKILQAGTEHPDAREGIYIDNAGLVLLHPFLPRFFRALGIASEDQLLQPERALFLLHYLTTGRNAAPEYELVLPKILCNVPLQSPVETCIEPTELEKEEAVVLLESVIRHWESLRSTSTDGLRGTFLLRPGKVSHRDDGDWLLQVETSAFDILLDQLPWGISPVDLPWMTRMLWVEWR